MELIRKSKAGRKLPGYGFLAGALLAALAGCGFYSMAGSIPPHIRSIAIPLVDNETAEFGMSESVTDYLVQRFLEENILRIVDEDQADSILRGTIIDVRDAAHTFTAQETVTEYRFTVVMNVEWYDVKQDKVLISRKYARWGAYGLGVDISNDGIDNDGDGYIDAEDDDEIGEPRTFATRIAVEQIAEDIINEILTAW